MSGKIFFVPKNGNKALNNKHLNLDNDYLFGKITYFTPGCPILKFFVVFHQKNFLLLLFFRLMERTTAPTKVYRKFLIRF